MIPLCPVEIFLFAALVLSALLISRFLEGIVPSVLMLGCAIGKNNFRKDVQFVPEVANLADGCECHDDSSCSRGRQCLRGLYALPYLIYLSYQLRRDEEEKEQEMCSISLQNRDFRSSAVAFFPIPFFCWLSRTELLGKDAFWNLMDSDTDDGIYDDEREWLKPKKFCHLLDALDGLAVPFPS